MTEVEDSNFQNSKKYVTVKEATKRISYTPDYIARLAREGKIESIRKGRQWLVELDSLKLFQLQADAEKKHRQAELSKVRQIERVVKTSLISSDDKLVTDSVLKKHAVLESAAVMMCVALLISLVSAYSSFRLSPSDLIAALDKVGRDFQGAVAIESAPDWSEFFWLVKTDKVLVSEKNILGTSSGLGNIKNEYYVPQVDLVSGEVVISSSIIGEVSNIFSDEVAIKFYDNRSGVITPVFENSNQISYPFVIDNREDDFENE